MGEVLILQPRSTANREPSRAAKKPDERVSLDECVRRAELIVQIAKQLAGVTADEPRIALWLRSQGGLIEDREWTVVAIVDGAEPKHVHGPVHSDDIDKLAGSVDAGSRRWADALRRRLAFEVA